MIRRFRHTGLKRLFDDGDPSRISPALLAKVERVLARLHEAAAPTDMDLPGFRLHRLKGDLSAYWAVRVSANWRVVFHFQDGDATDVDLVNYH